MKKLYSFLLILFISSCASLNLQERYERVFVNEQEEVMIKWSVDYKFPTQKKGHLIITNPDTKSSFKMTYEEFFIMKKSYENWRVVEKGKPIITNIKEDGKYITTTFNYFDENTVSILSGIFVVDTNVITKKDKELWLWRILSGTGWAAFMLVLLI